MRSLQQMSLFSSVLALKYAERAVALEFLAKFSLDVHYCRKSLIKQKSQWGTAPAYLPSPHAHTVPRNKNFWLLLVQNLLELPYFEGIRLHNPPRSWLNFVGIGFIWCRQNNSPMAFYAYTCSSVMSFTKTRKVQRCGLVVETMDCWREDDLLRWEPISMKSRKHTAEGRRDTLSPGLYRKQR